ncbi:predicted protein [Phaeodactylum tricornutum CCAP 1055/1]|uniref:Transmembrane protein n=1 Tax=Phaeodactylum tricornutum (strain CCAP 1055/1) TaxID=556484 RepID=B7GBT0_PHATC|nr:predicted protein [Phaeodactylum tricornutum CCAP 1055/1]EEC43979.1 predicted protein [Phaeodactylum tricornutum CCAP 1055/1]|eukprot:XP_002184580.1 predicted protein [Phaeodactylum tricornutum CCAP 1055/1]
MSATLRSRFAVVCIVVVGCWVVTESHTTDAGWEHTRFGSGGRHLQRHAWIFYSDADRTVSDNHLKAEVEEQSTGNKAPLGTAVSVILEQQDAIPPIDAPASNPPRLTTTPDTSGGRVSEKYIPETVSGTERKRNAILIGCLVGVGSLLVYYSIVISVYCFYRKFVHKPGETKVKANAIKALSTSVTQRDETESDDNSAPWASREPGKHTIRSVPRESRMRSQSLTKDDIKRAHGDHVRINLEEKQGDDGQYNEHENDSDNSSFVAYLQSLEEATAELYGRVDVTGDTQSGAVDSRRSSRKSKDSPRQHTATHAKSNVRIQKDRDGRSSVSEQYCTGQKRLSRSTAVVTPGKAAYVETTKPAFVQFIRSDTYDEEWAKCLESPRIS